jgi:predicted MFS family arabinose efflux permease
MGFLFSVYSLVAGLSVLLWGPISDAFGRKNCLLAGLVLFSAGSVVSLSAKAFLTLLMGRAVTGLGASMLSLNALSFAADFFPYSARGWAMGSILSSYFAALILGVPIGSLVGDHFGWNSVFGLVACAGVCLMVSSWILLPRLGERSKTRISTIAILRGSRNYLHYLKTRRTLGSIAGGFFASAGTMGFLAFLGVWLHDDFGISAKQTGLVFLASGAAAFIASPLAGSLSDRIGKQTQFIGSSIFLAFLLLALPHLKWGIPLFGLFFSISLAAAFRQGPLEALLSEVVPAAGRGSFLALKNSFSQLGIGSASVLSGLLFEWSGYGAVCLLCFAANVAAVAAVFWAVRGQKL